RLVLALAVLVNEPSKDALSAPRLTRDQDGGVSSRRPVRQIEYAPHRWAFRDQGLWGIGWSQRRTQSYDFTFQHAFGEGAPDGVQEGLNLERLCQKVTSASLYRRNRHLNAAISSDQHDELGRSCIQYGPQ